MGRFISADDPESAAGTSDEAAALKDEEGNPVANSARNTWVTATALSTALNMSYMAEQVALFGIVVGVALLLAGIGFLILTLSGALRTGTAAARTGRSGNDRPRVASLRTRRSKGPDQSGPLAYLDLAPRSHCCILGSCVGSAYMGGQP